MREPNFFIVGAPKAGTTSLYHYLRQHPDIYMSPIKEPSYFSFEVRPGKHAPGFEAQALATIERTREYLSGPMDKPSSGGLICDWQDYLRLYAAATTQHAVGEASVFYMVSQTAAAAIAERYPDAKILMVLRSPTECAFSQYMHFVSAGLVNTSFREHVYASQRHAGEGIGIHEPFLQIGFYAAQVQRYLDHFPRNQVAIWIYEENIANPREFLRQVFHFLGVDDTFTPDTSTRHNPQPKIPRLRGASKLLRWVRMTQLPKRLLSESARIAVRRVVYRPNGSATMSAADRVFMQDFYRNDIHQLQTILGRDLSAWLA